MTLKNSLLPVVFAMSLFMGPLQGQTALRLPELLTRAEKRITTNCILSRTGIQLTQPWVVYSDREEGNYHFGDKYYVVAERETEVHVYKASGHSNRKLVNAEDKGWRRKSDLLVTFGADFTGNSLIHKKCVILNHHKTIERIKRGEISESEVPLYRSSTSMEAVDNVPLYLIYFVYKIENNRYLLGKDYKFDPDLPFHGQIVGWVDRDRVFDYNNRICFEPSFEASSVVQRRCNPLYAARVFEFESELARFLKGDSTQKPIWVEPDYYFFRNPRYLKDVSGNREPMQLEEKEYSDSFREKLCADEGNIAETGRSNLLTGMPLHGNKFRFPLIRRENLPENVFMTGVTGRFENEVKSRSLLCEALKTNKSQIAVYFILDHSVDRNHLVYVIGQIQQEFRELDKTFGVCFYPRVQLGQFKISIGGKGAAPSMGNYRYVKDFIGNFNPGKYAVPKDNALLTLKYVLDNENFEARQTNILVIVNNHALDVPDAGMAELRADIEEKIVEKNCYILAFDCKNDNGLVQQIQELSVAAAKKYARKLNIGSNEIAFKKTGLGYEMENAGLLSIIEQTDTSRLAAAQMQAFLQNGYVRIVNTLHHAIEQICLNTPRPGSAGMQHEDPFQRSLRVVPGMEGKVQYIRALEEGFSSVKYDFPSGNYKDDIWKANVIMTKPELESLASLLDKMLVQENNSSFSKSITELWISLFNRFVGDNLAPEEIMHLTPQAIMNRILGETYGYTLSDPVKRFPLQRILANDQEVQKHFEGYRSKLISANNTIREILTSGRLRFSLTEDAVTVNQGSTRSGIYYYWVPMDILP